MGFSASIIKFNRNRLANPDMTDVEIASNWNDIYREVNIDFEKDYVEDWCSAGRYWFDSLGGYIDQLDDSEGSYVWVINKDNYSKLVEYAITLFKAIELNGFNISKAMNRLEDEDGSYVCRNIDGILAIDEDGGSREFWTGYDEFDFLTTKKYIAPDQYYSIFSFCKAVLSLAATDWDNEVVIINGGW